MTYDSRRVADLFTSLYGNGRVEANIERYRKALEAHRRLFSLPKGSRRDGSLRDGGFFSAPGRIEIGGNHTDHNGGLVLAASVGIDAVCRASKNDEGMIRIFSEGFSDVFSVSLDDLGKREEEEGTTAAIIRGIASRFKELGYAVGGWDGYITSDVPVGSGLSSSASIEVVVADVLNHLYNNSEIGPVEIARAGQYAENTYFNKPCGLMDQIASAVGGVVQIDFADAENPVVRRVDFSFRDSDYAVLVVQTGCCHADLTPDYAAVPEEMRQVAGELGHSVMRGVELEELLGQVKKLRSNVSDRAILRAYHFIRENERVTEQRAALENKDLDRFLDLVTESGNSSQRWLQNSFSVREPGSQGVTLALALTEDFFRKRRKGAYRVHGGGFAGTILVFAHKEDVGDYIKQMEKIFGEGAVRMLFIRPVGAVCLGDFFER